MTKYIFKWFEINLGWFFINGRKQQQWNEFLKEKYGKFIKINRIKCNSRK